LTRIGAALAVIFSLTLRHGEMPSIRGFGWCVGCGVFGTLDVILNVALFIPLGAAIAWRKPQALRWVARAAAVSLAVSLAIEMCQLFLVRGRDPTLSDIVGNTLGGTVGACLVTFGPRITRASRATWRGLTWSSALLSAGALVLGAWAVGLTVPLDRYYTQWEPQRPSYAPFRGHLVTLSINGLTLTPGAEIHPRRLPASFFDGRIAMEATIEPGSPPSGIALIARISLVPDELLMLGQQREALVGRYRANAYRVGLRSPIYALERIPRSEGMVAARMRIDAERGEVELRAATSSSVHVALYRVTTARFWAALLPLELAFDRWALIGDVLWLGMLFGPVAYAGARSSTGWMGIVPATALGFFALVTQPSLRWWPFAGGVVLAVVLSYLLGVRGRLGAEKPPAHGSRTLEQNVLPLDAAEEA
jgi:hypothetical protein